jgi:sigma-B regulation protein RsbU (phosphoserine phosphatase)
MTEATSLARTFVDPTAVGADHTAAAVFRAPSSEEAREAHRIQRRLLPVLFPKMGDCDLHGSWLPANAVGGDYYDVIAIDESRIAFCIADVSGKGLPAALLMASIQASLRAVIRTSSDPVEICCRANRLVFESTTPERFVTFFIAVLDTSTGSFEYSNAGHVAPVLIAEDGSTTSLVDGGSALGFFDDGVWERGSGTIGPGDRLVLLTDGLTEAENDAGEAFGDARLLESLLRYRSRQSAEFHDALFEDARRFSGRLQDDASLLTVTFAANQGRAG